MSTAPSLIRHHPHQRAKLTSTSSSSPPPTPSPSSHWIAHLRLDGFPHRLTTRLAAPDLRAAEEYAVAITAFRHRANPASLTVITLRQIQR